MEKQNRIVNYPKIIEQNCKSILKNSNIQMHNFYIRKQKECRDISENDKGDMTRQKSSCINGCTIQN